MKAGPPKEGRKHTTLTSYFLPDDYNCWHSFINTVWIWHQKRKIKTKLAVFGIIFSSSQHNKIKEYSVIYTFFNIMTPIQNRELFGCKISIWDKLNIHCKKPINDVIHKISLRGCSQFVWLRCLKCIAIWLYFDTLTKLRSCHNEISNATWNLSAHN